MQIVCFELNVSFPGKQIVVSQKMVCHDVNNKQILYSTIELFMMLKIVGNLIDLEPFKYLCLSE